MFSIIGITRLDLQKIALTAHKVTSSIAKGRYYNVTPAGPNTVLFTMPNSPYPSEYWQGIFEAVLEKFNVKGTVTLKKDEASTKEFIIKW